MLGLTVSVVCSRFAEGLRLCAISACLLFFSSSLPAQPAAETSSRTELTLKDYLRSVLEHNESIQVKMLEVQVSQKKYQAERGIFEPEAVLGIERDRNKRQNNIEQQASQRVGVFDEVNNIYNGGLEALVPSGGRLRLGYTLRDLRNNIDPAAGIFGSSGNRFFTQYQTFFGLSLNQPLLKNAGFAATLANIRLAAIQSDVAFEEYRRQMMIVVSTAEATYWNLYMAQEQLLFFQDSVALAEIIRNDNRSRLQAGKGSELEVLEGESGLALRQSKQAEARQKYFDSLNRLTQLYSASAITTNQRVIAVNEPELTDAPLSMFDSYFNAFDLNPDYQSQRKKMLQENIRLAYAKNQRLPQLDLKASYGLNGLGLDPSDSWSDVQRRDFPSYVIGLEFRVPITGGIKGRNEVDAAKLRQQQALITLKEIEVQIANALDTAMRKVRSARDSVHNYETVIHFAKSLLDNRRAQFDAGRVESRKVFEADAELFESRNALLEAKIMFQRALLELELIEGSILKHRNLEMTRREVDFQTAGLVRRGRISEEDQAQFFQSLQWRYANTNRGDTPSTPKTNPPPAAARP